MTKVWCQEYAQGFDQKKPRKKTQQGLLEKGHNNTDWLYNPDKLLKVTKITMKDKDLQQIVNLLKNDDMEDVSNMHNQILVRMALQLVMVFCHI